MIFPRFVFVTLSLAIAPVAWSADARDIFSTHCANCHGADARGTSGVPDLTDARWQYGGANADIQRTITYGRVSVMPALGMPLGDAGLEQVVAYVQSLASDDESESQAHGTGRELFAMYCASCHGADGSGTQALGAPDLSDAVWLYGGDAASIRDVVLNGRSNAMPAYAGVLSVEDIQALVRLLDNFEKMQGDIL